MQNPEIDKLIASLSKEIEKTKGDEQTEAQMMRLKAVAGVYKGDDEVVLLADLPKAPTDEKKVMSGFKGLDTILGGFRGSQLIVVSAATKSGKTTFCMEMTFNMADETPLWLSFEESMEELSQKFEERGKPVPHLATPKAMKGNTLAWIEKKIVEAKVKYNTGVVFIDHLHFIIPMGGERQDLAIGEAMRALKGFARTWDVTIFLIAHIKKVRVDKSPTLEDLRDSSFIAQEADTVIMLYRHAYTDDEGDTSVTNNVNVSVLANRRTGKTGNVKMVFEDGRFLEKEWKRAEVESSGWGMPMSDL